MKLEDLSTNRDFAILFPPLCDVSFIFASGLQISFTVSLVTVLLNSKFDLINSHIYYICFCRLEIWNK